MLINYFPDKEIIINIKELGNGVSEGDVLEIYHQEDDDRLPRLLLQIPSVSKEEINVQKGGNKYFI